MRMRWKLATGIVAVIVIIMLFLSVVGYRATVPDVNDPNDSDNDGIPNDEDTDDDNDRIPDDQEAVPPPQKPTAYAIVTVPIVIKSNFRTGELIYYIGSDPVTPFVPVSVYDYVDELTGQLSVWKQLDIFKLLKPYGEVIRYPKITYWVVGQITEIATQQNLNWTSDAKTYYNFVAFRHVIRDSFQSGRFFLFNEGDYVLKMTLWLDYYAPSPDNRGYSDPVRLYSDTVTYPFKVAV